MSIAFAARPGGNMVRSRAQLQQVGEAGEYPEDIHFRLARPVRMSIVTVGASSRA